MKKKSVSQFAFLSLRFLVTIALLTGSAATALFAAAAGLGRESAIARSGEIKTSSELPAGTGQWFWQRPLPQGNPLYAVALPDGINGIAVGEDATILRTTDGGAHWTIQTSGYEGARVELFAVSFTDASHGTAVGSNFFFSGGGNAVVLRTTDGGGTWATKYSDPTPGILFFGVSFSDANTGTVVGVDFNLGAALILRTTDGGDTCNRAGNDRRFPSSRVGICAGRQECQRRGRSLRL